MLKYWFTSLLFVLSLSTFGRSISYTLSTPKPQDHYYHVEMQLDGFKEKELDVKMPVWAPGSYLVREFAKNLNLVKAFDQNGKALKVVKTNKNTWCIKKGKASKVTVKYEVYAFELSVRTSFLDMTHGFVSGSGVFMYVKGYKDMNGRVDIKMHPIFSAVTTALKPNGEEVARDGLRSFVFEDYDHLVDSPIEIGNQEIFSFEAAGAEHEVAMYGSANYDIEQLKVDMKKVIEATTDVFGQNPNKKYTFIIHNVVDAQGGLEHKESTVLSVNRWTYEGPKYIGFLSLVAHEYFHLWNVKRIRPVELGPFNYDEENYTTLLWVMEGFTSYYDELILRRAGFYSEKDYLAKLFSTINYVEGSTGTRVQPVAHASFDAWIKAYRPNENSRNTTMSYYSRGTVLASLIDAMIIEKYDGKKCLDHFLRHLYDTFYVGKDRGFSEAEFKSELEEFTGRNLDDFFAKYVHGTEIPPYNDYFSPIGVNVEYKGEPKPSVGLSLKSSEGRVIVRGIRSGSAAENAGLSVNDEIIGCNGFRAEQKSLEDYFKTVKTGEEIEIVFAREAELYSTIITVSEYEKPSFKYTPVTSEKTDKLFNYWLRTL